MAEESEPKNWEEWLATRPPAVQVVAKEFPVGEHFHADTLYKIGEHVIAGMTPVYVIGYREVLVADAEEVWLAVSLYNPHTEYERSIEHNVTMPLSAARAAGLCGKKDERKSN